MNGQNLSLKIESGTFNYRVGAIIISDGHILMSKNNSATHYYTVGGRVMFGESSKESILREVVEEIKIPLEVDRLVYIHENFFLWSDEKVPFHEIAYYFLMKVPDGFKKSRFSSIAEGYGEVNFHWLPLNGLSDLVIYPDFLKSEAKILSEGVGQCATRDVGHYVTKGGETIKM